MYVPSKSTHCYETQSSKLETTFKIGSLSPLIVRLGMYITYYARLVQMYNRAMEAATIEHFCPIFS